MERSRKCHIFVSLIFFMVAFFVFFMIYTCTDSVCFGAQDISIVADPEYEAFLKGHTVRHRFHPNDLMKERTVDFEGEDVLVYLHIQKTGGATFGRHLVHDLDVDPPCECIPGVKKCECFTRNNRVWLFSRHSVGWKCGLHADWTELQDCVDDWFQKTDVPMRKFRRYHWVTFLRNPVDRFFSEWQHVRRGATWSTVRLYCNGRSATREEVPRCYDGDDWSGVTFDEFIGCKYNLAFNRMTRMLANLSLVNCYNRTGLDDASVSATLLQSAKDNLLNFAFFGLVEEQQKTQFLFERTFGLRFIKDFLRKRKTHVDKLTINKEQKKMVSENNKMDVGLYQFARDLFQQRVEAMEKRLGYTVQEYFDTYRDVGDEEDEEDAEDEEDVEEEEEMMDRDDEEGDELDFSTRDLLSREEARLDGYSKNLVFDLQRSRTR